MWSVLTLIALALLIVVHVGWSRRCRRLSQGLKAAAEHAIALEERHVRALAEAEARQQAVFNSMAEGLLLLEETGRIRLVNQAFERLFGLPVDIRGQTIIEALRSLPLQEVVEQTLETGQVLNTELELPGSTRRVLSVNASVLSDRTGKSQGLILVFHELTRLKQLENTRKDFVANVSHELRTPLSMIKGYAETLLGGAKDDPEVTTRFLQTIRKNADRLAFLIEDLLSLSQLESGRMALNVERFALCPLVNEVFSDLQSRAVEKGIVLENELSPELFIRADADRVQQVLYNLIDNAIKYTPGKGRVRVTANPAQSGKVCLSVQDQGIGIPEEARERIFERFYRVDLARSREQGGTGLGLAIVKHIVQSHGGEVWVESEPGQTTTFFLTLPGAEAPAEDSVCP
jgi:two-component system, OmpR family, phosphate regulon sensor histidine kinase PhoR